MTISRLLLPKRLLLTVILSVACVPSLLAVEITQSLPLRYGWNAVWLEVAPVDGEGQARTADQVFKSSEFAIDRVASPVGQIGTAEFTSDPESLFNQGGWDVWAADPQSGETASIAVRANHAYLVHVSPNSGISAAAGTAAGSLEIQGEVAFHRPEWVKGEFNLAGFSIQGAPTFASLMAGSGVVVDGPVGAVANVQRLNADTGAWEAVKGSDPVESGRAYWINVPYALKGKGWAGPVEIDFSGAVSGALNFGQSPGSLAVVNPADPAADPLLMSATELSFSNLEASGGAQHSVTLTRLLPSGPGDSGNDLAFYALEPVPQELKWRTQQVDFTAGWLHSTLDPGLSRAATVGVTRNWTTGLNVREHLYRLSVSLSGGSVYRYLPVRATQADLPADSSGTPPANQFTGLWYGEVVLDSVSSLATAGAPVQKAPSPLSMQLFIHVDVSGQARLVPRSILMQTKTASTEVAPSPVLVVNETRLPFLEGVQQRADGLRVGLRFETVSYDLPRNLSAASLSALLRDDVAKARGIANSADVTDADVEAYFSLGTKTSRPADLPETYYLSWPLDGQIGVGKTLSTGSSSPLTLDAFHRSNPFRHGFHPQHGAGYPVTRSFTITFEASPAPTIFNGTYRETTRGLARQDIVSGGTIFLRRVSTAGTLQ